MRLEVTARASSQLTQLSNGTPLRRNSVLTPTAPTALQDLLARLLDDLSKLSNWLNAFARPQQHTSEEKAFAAQKSVAPFRRQNLGTVFAFDSVTVDFAAMEARRHGTLVTLTTKEFEVLTYLIRNAGRVVSRDELLKEVWGYECYPNTRTVDNRILHLRQKLEPEPSRPRHFLTVRGAGYKFLPLESTAG